MRILQTLALSVALVAVSAAASFAQRGEGRITGKVVDEQGQPVADVAIRATKKDSEGQPPIQSKSNTKGEWTLAQLATGEWTIEFTKDGFQTQRGTITLDESGNVPRVDVKLAKNAPDPNVEIQAELKRADSLLRANQFAEARKVYEDLLAKHPSIHQLHRFIAAGYAGEKNYAKAVEHLKLVLEKEPTNPTMKMLMAELLMEQGTRPRAWRCCRSVDITQVKDPLPFINAAHQPDQRWKARRSDGAAEQVGERFPKQNEIYYYRGRAIHRGEEDA